MKENLYLENLIKVYFLFLLTTHTFFLYQHLGEFPSKYVFSDWLINYEGGFIRRGLLGQVIYEILIFTKFKIENIIFFFQITAYLSYFILMIRCIKNLKLNFFWILLIFSTISLLYPISELEALGRKDIYVLLLFLCFSFINYKSFSILIFSFILIFTISTLIHEITLFYILFYFLIIGLNNKYKFKKTINISYIIILLIYLLLLIYLILAIGNKADIQSIIDSYKIELININIGTGAIGWLSKSFIDQIIYVTQNISLINFMRYFYILVINVLVITYFLNLKFLLFNKFNIKLILTFLIISVFPVYFIALDWGRITYITFNFIIILIFYLNHQNLIDHEYIEKRVNKISEKIKFLIFIIVCVSFAPKILLTDDLSGIPIYKILRKLVESLFIV